MSSELVPVNESGLASYDRPQVPTIARDIVAPRLPEVGRIRLGEKDEKRGYPKKLTAFRFTSRNRSPLEMVAELWGGTVVPWASDEGPQWQVYTTATSIEVIVPKAELSFSQHFEDWEGATCNRRCDGHWEMQGDRPCVCDPAARKCLPTTRLSVLLPDVPGMGVWRVESHGYNAAAEILGTIELAAAHGATLLPATLTLESRSKRRYNPDSGKVETRRFVVPVLAISASLREMVAEQHALRQRTLGLLPMAERATPDRMRALRTAVFTRWPDSVDEPERSIRLRQLSALLGRPVTTISNDHDLTAQEAIFLTNAVEELPDDVSQSSAGSEPGEAQPIEAGQGPDFHRAQGPPAEHHTQPAPVREQAASALSGTSAAGAESTAPPSSAGEGESQPDVVYRADNPAEHHTAEGLGEVPPADGTKPGGLSQSDTGQPSGRVPTPPKKRRPTDPTGAPKVAQAMQQAQQFRAERMAQQETVQPPVSWLKSLPTTEKLACMRAAAEFSNTPQLVVEKEAEKIGRAYGKDLNHWSDEMEWNAEQLAALLQEIQSGDWQ